MDEELRKKGVSEHTGFPNAATDSSLTSLDLAKLLIKNPASTFFMRIRGSDWEERGIFDNDVVVIDRAVVPKKTSLVIWWVADSFVIGDSGQVPEEIPVWGTVTNVIHNYQEGK